jgi:acetoin utilization protein AcuB
MIAAEIMTDNPRTVRPTDPVSAAVEMLQTLRVRHLPVTDERGHLIGMLSDRDLGSWMRTFTEGAEAAREVVPLSRRNVAEFMSGVAVSVEGDAELQEIIGQMLEERVGALPVVDGADNVIGIVSYVDVLRAVSAELEAQADAAAAEPPATSPGERGPSLSPRYDVRPWGGGWGVFAKRARAAVEPFRTSADAVAHAKELARHSANGAQIRVVNESGSLVSEFFYQPDERASLDRDGAVPSVAASRPAHRGGR